MNHLLLSFKSIIIIIEVNRPDHVLLNDKRYKTSQPLPLVSSSPSLCAAFGRSDDTASPSQSAP